MSQGVGRRRATFNWPLSMSPLGEGSQLAEPVFEATPLSQCSWHSHPNLSSVSAVARGTPVVSFCFLAYRLFILDSLIKFTAEKKKRTRTQPRTCPESFMCATSEEKLRGSACVGILVALRGWFLMNPACEICNPVLQAAGTGQP